MSDPILQKAEQIAAKMASDPILRDLRTKISDDVISAIKRTMDLVSDPLEEIVLTQAAMSTAISAYLMTVSAVSGRINALESAARVQALTLNLGLQMETKIDKIKASIKPGMSIEEILEIIHAS